MRIGTVAAPRLAVALALMLAALVMGAAAPAEGASDALCGQASDLVRDADPGAALTLIDKREQALDEATGTDAPAVCPGIARQARYQQVKADAAVKAAKGHLKDAKEAGEKAANTDDPTKKRAAESEQKVALAAAQASLDEAKGLDAKDAEYVRLSTETTKAEDFQESWDSFVSDWLEPLGVPLGVALAIALGWLVLGRILVQAYATRVPLLNGRLSPGLLIAGALCALASGLLFTLLVPSSDAGPDRWWSYIAVAVLGAVAAVALAIGLAIRLRVTIEAMSTSETKDMPSAARIVAILRKLGADAPRGVEVPVGTDVNVLADAVTKVAPKGWVSSVVDALSAVLGFTPWKVVIDRTAGGTAVLITRNGRTVDSAIVRADILGPDSPSASPDVLVASFILMTLADNYRNRAGFEGLLGSTSWKSIAYVASTQGAIAPPAATAPSEVRRMLAAAALLEDNPFARIALYEDLYRNRDEPEIAEGYARWLHKEAMNDLYDSGAGLATRARLLCACISVTLNVLGTRPADGVARKRLKEAFVQIDEVLLKVGRQPGTFDQIYGRMTVLKMAKDAALARASALQQGEPTIWDGDQEEKIGGVALTALGQRAYNTMCDLASRDAGLTRAVTLYEVVCADPQNRAWSLVDPSLEKLRHDGRMWTFVAKGNDLLGAAPFAVHAPALREVGLTSVAAIARTSAEGLAGLIATTQERADRLVDLAILLDTLPPELAGRSVDVLAVLVEWGATTLALLSANGDKVGPALREIPGFRRADAHHAAAEAWMTTNGVPALV
ncbi:hypothetical protein [Cellulomonas sp. URHD0024]|uniref:hypothetical protein n=1 Tax=Cellulomonas sp. URHD0024 TaxID=1302620 RepID=UPI0012DF3336|nr:hypothetical protein [Cellulomonas sp. URHD0024]